MSIELLHMDCMEYMATTTKQWLDSSEKQHRLNSIFELEQPSHR